MAVKKETVRAGIHEAMGILLLALCAIGILSLFSFDPGDIGILNSPPNHPPANFIGPVGAWFGFLTFFIFGVCGYLVPAGLAYLGLICIFKREGRIWPKALWLLAFLVTVCCLMELSAGTWSALRAKVNTVGAGGVLGDVVGQRIFVNLMGVVGTGILSVALMFVSVIMLFEVHPVVLGQRVWAWLSATYEKFEENRRGRLDRVEQLEEEARDVAKKQARLARVMKGQERPVGEYRREEKAAARKIVQDPEADLEPAPVSALQPVSEPDADAVPLVEQAVDLIKKVRARAARPAVPKPEPEELIPVSTALPPPNLNFTLPPLSLLDDLPPPKDRELKADHVLGSQMLKEVLAEFGIEVEVTNAERGPVVTRYELLPAAGVRVERIGNLSNNIALAMKAESVRVQAPIPGKGVVGIEISNPKTNKVFLREILESDAWKNNTAALPLVLGQDVGGREMIADLSKMPHLLIAGATGSGKTVCMNSILAGLLMSRTPEQMRLILIDPKIVEFSGYNHLPHLVVPVITEAKKVSLGLRWAITEMENRYKLFAKVGVRNIDAYNSRVIVKQQDLFGDGAVPAGDDEDDKVPDRVPYIVIVVDELADLMLVAQAEIENQIARLAQLSRAVGIHMVLATQRPSVNVITGTIKANFPARIAFQVAQANDSRTILDSMGADKLLGKGDMLFLNPGLKHLIRAQGTLTTDAEIQRIVAHLKAQGQPQYEMAIKEKLESKTTDLPEMEEDDDLMAQALEIIRQTRRASTSSLQRRLRIGYTRAARIMDLMEQKGVVGPAQGSDPREILVDLDGEVPANEAQKIE